jgi:hypothetical protein
MAAQNPSASSPDSTAGSGPLSGNAGGERPDSSAASVPVVNPGARKRIRRACDKCSKSRTRCDGEFPWLESFHSSEVVSRSIYLANFIHIKSALC